MISEKFSQEAFWGLLIASLAVSSIALLGLWFIFYRTEMNGWFYGIPDMGMPFELIIVLPFCMILNSFFIVKLMLRLRRIERNLN